MPQERTRRSWSHESRRSDTAAGLRARVGPRGHSASCGVFTHAILTWGPARTGEIANGRGYVDLTSPRVSATRKVVTTKAN